MDKVSKQAFVLYFSRMLQRCFVLVVKDLLNFTLHTSADLKLKMKNGWVKIFERVTLAIFSLTDMLFLLKLLIKGSLIANC